MSKRKYIGYNNLYLHKFYKMIDTPNLSYINQLSNGNKTFKEHLLNIIKKELPQEIETYHSCLKVDNYTETAECVHKINHKFKILGLEKGHKVAEDYRLNLLNKSKILKVDFENILNVLLLFIKTA